MSISFMRRPTEYAVVPYSPTQPVASAVSANTTSRTTSKRRSATVLDTTCAMVRTFATGTVGSTSRIAVRDAEMTVLGFVVVRIRIEPANGAKFQYGK